MMTLAPSCRTQGAKLTIIFGSIMFRPPSLVRLYFLRPSGARAIFFRINVLYSNIWFVTGGGGLKHTEGANGIDLVFVLTYLENQILKIGFVNRKIGKNRLNNRKSKLKFFHYDGAIK